MQMISIPKRNQRTRIINFNGNISVILTNKTNLPIICLIDYQRHKPTNTFFIKFFFIENC